MVMGAFLLHHPPTATSRLAFWLVRLRAPPRAGDFYEPACCSVAFSITNVEVIGRKMIPSEAVNGREFGCLNFTFSCFFKSARRTTASVAPDTGVIPPSGGL